MDMTTNTRTRTTNWTTCCLCQQDKKEDLKSPHTNPTKSRYDGYVVLARNIPLFHSLNALPIKLDPGRLDEGNGIEETLRMNNARYHESCRLLFNNTKLQRAEKRTSSITPTDEGSSIKMPRSNRQPASTYLCFFCEKGDSTEELRHAMTMRVDQRINECARTLNDGRLLAKLSAGDAIAQELKYHPSCLADLYNRERACLREREKDQESVYTRDAYPIAFSELVTYINEAKVACVDNAPLVLRLAELVTLFQNRLLQLGVEMPEVHATRLKEQLIFHIPQLRAYQQGRDVLLAYDTDVGGILEQTSKYSAAIHLAKAAELIRRDMLNNRSSQFTNDFNDGCLQHSVPPSLVAFVGMIEHGADIKSQLQHGTIGASKSDLVISQLLQYNCFAKYKEGTQVHRHSKDRETPFAVYLALCIFAKTRKRQLIDILHNNGLCISYDRVLEISAKLGEAVVSQYVKDEVVCPPVLRKHLFTTSAVDNIDHNPTATTAKSSFHGTSLSIFQHPRSDYAGEIRAIPQTSGDTKVKRVPELPEAFTSVRPAHMAKNPTPPKLVNLKLPTPDSIQSHLKEEYAWLEYVSLAENVGDAVSITWSTHHAAQNRGHSFEVSITSLLPLIRDQAHSVATIKHAMDKIRETVAFLNPGQTPVVAADQPLYAIAKQIQWQWSEYGEDKFVVIFGGLHIEIAALRSIGTLLHDSGWTGAIVEAGVASPGSAESFLAAAGVTRTRQAHQITACSLYKLRKQAYQDYCTNDRGTASMDFEDWCVERRRISPQFQFWNLILDMELAIFRLIRSFREGNFELYRSSLLEMLPYFFANNNTNYARWITIHLHDMLDLEDQHPNVAREFHKGNFVVHKSKRRFSAMAIDQAHEQNNAVIKGDGGAIGVTEDPAALRRWMVAGPEVSRLLARYEEVAGSSDTPADIRHHEDTVATQTSFFKKVQAMTTVLREMGNPFQEESSDLLALDTKNIADPALAMTVITHHEKGRQQFQLFLHGLQHDESYFYKPIKKNKPAFFKQEKPHSSSKEKVLKVDCQLFSRLFISCQSRQCDLQEFFSHENQSAPASLSDGGKLHTCQKSQLVEILQAQVDMPHREPYGDAVIVDGSALVNTQPPGTVKTFEEYAKDDILPKVELFGSKYKRVDIVFDVYRNSSLKSETRMKRGQGVRRRVVGTGKTPTNWRSFLRDDNNKTELFQFLAERICLAQTRSTVLVTKEDNVICNDIHKSLDAVTPCRHEEADTRMFVHARDAALAGCKAIVIKANDTDVVVIAVSILPQLQELGIETLWTAFGQGSSMKWIPIHEMITAIGPARANALTYFHAFTGSDVVSAFRGKGKKSAWQTWSAFDEITETFVKLSQFPTEVSDTDLHKLERFVVLMYDRSSAAIGVNEARLHMFARKQRPYDSIPPTQAALREHAKRAAYQAAVIWGQATCADPDIGSPADWGWTWTGDSWKVCWSTLPSIATCCQELTKCSCKNGCTRRCKCIRSELPCTALCSCACEQ